LRSRNAPLSPAEFDALRSVESGATMRRTWPPESEGKDAMTDLDGRPADDIHELVSRNRLLAALEPSDLLLLKAALKSVPLTVRQVLEEPLESISDIYFVLSGIVSVVGRAFPSHRIEVGMVGYEGMTGLSVVLGDGRAAHEMLVQCSGSALSMPAAELKKAMNESRTLTSVMLRYAQAFMVQSNQTALANGRGVLEERLARWLLMWRDRLQDDSINITHQFLAILLGSPRPGVTLSLHVLEGRGLIKASRSLIRIMDREGLQKAANGFYGIPEAEYDRLMDAPSR